MQNKNKNKYYFKKTYNKDSSMNKDSESLSGDPQMSYQLHKAKQGNIITISKRREPACYLNLIRMHFTHNSDTLHLQALGLSSTNLVTIAFLATLKGYATYKRIKNDHMTVPMLDYHTGQQIGLTKRVRLNVKLTRHPNFFQVVENEKKPKQNVNNPEPDYKYQKPAPTQQYPHKNQPP